jgi:hypothetical protein
MTSRSLSPGAQRHRTNSINSIPSSALASRAGDAIRRRRRLFSPRVLVEHAQHGRIVIRRYKRRDGG